MFTYRQLSLLSYLIGSEEGLSGHFLSETLDISTKTLQSEIKNLNSLLSESERIIYIPKRGYYIDNLTPEMRDTILKAVNDAKYRSNINNRANKILTILAFEKDYLSMEGLANRLFLSKSAVRKEFETSWRLRNIVEVSPVRGLRINAKESAKRNLLSKVFSQDDEILELPGLHGDYRKLSADLYRLLSAALTEHQYILSGESLRIFNNYLLITVLRSREGFVIEENPEPVRVSRLMQKVKSRIQAETGIAFDDAELILCQKKLNESSIVLGTRKMEDNAGMQVLEERLELFRETVLVKTGIRITMDSGMKRLFLLHMYKLKLRTENKVDNANFNKREINRRYPLTAHLIREWFIPIFELRVAESEISYIILYFAAMTEWKKPVVTAVYVSDQHPSMSYHGMELLKSHFGERLVLDETMPQYRFNRMNKACYADHLIITTERTVLMENKHAVMVKPILTQSDLNAIVLQLESLQKRLAGERLGRLKKRYTGAEPVVLVAEKPDNMEALVTFLNLDLGMEGQESVYDLVLDNQIAYFPVLFEDERESYIKHYQLSCPFRYKGMEIQDVVLSGYNLKEGQIQDFYEVVRQIISGNG